MPEFYTEKEAAEVLRVHPGTLANWRWLSKGPDFYRLEGKILYSKKDLTRYAGSIRCTAKVSRTVMA
jgi:Helix-turn-helix domain